MLELRVEGGVRRLREQVHEVLEAVTVVRQAWLGQRRGKEGGQEGRRLRVLFDEGPHHAVKAVGQSRGQDIAAHISPTPKSPFFNPPLVLQLDLHRHLLDHFRGNAHFLQDAHQRCLGVLVRGGRQQIAGGALLTRGGVLAMVAQQFQSAHTIAQLQVFLLAALEPRLQIQKPLLQPGVLVLQLDRLLHSLQRVLACDTHSVVIRRFA